MESRQPIPQRDRATRRLGMDGAFGRRSRAAAPIGSARLTDGDLSRQTVSHGRLDGVRRNGGVRRQQLVSDDQPQPHLLRAFATVVTEEMARERKAAGVPNWQGRLLSEVLEETGGEYESVLDSFPDRVVADLHSHVDEEDDPVARHVLRTGRLVVPFENLRGLDPATTRVALGFGFGRGPA